MERAEGLERPCGELPGLGARLDDDTVTLERDVPRARVRSDVRIGLYGPMANAGYTLARGLRAAGYEAEYIHDPTDRYPMSQPLWEEVEVIVDPSRLPDDLPTVAEWEESARTHGWIQPPWVVQIAPAAAADFSLGHYVRGARILARAPRSGRQLRVHTHAHASRIATFGRYDWLVVCGVAVVDAFLSGTSYAYWPNGGDLSLVPFRDETPYDRFQAAAMRAAVRGATVCGTHDPTLADNFGTLGVRHVPFLPFLVDTQRYAPRAPESWGALAREIQRRAAGRPTLFLAARQDVRWKGTDRFARAFSRAIRGGSDLFLVVSPWGDDVGFVRGLLDEGVPADAVFELPGVVSKPLLVELYSTIDVVVDQFVLGVHGSTMLEALACGTPVMIWLDVQRFQSRWPSWTPPPVLNVSSEEEILESLRSIGADELDLAALGQAGREWVERVHGVGNAHRFLDADAEAPSLVPESRLA